MAKYEGEKVTPKLSYLYKVCESHLIITLFKLLNRNENYSIPKLRNEIEFKIKENHLDINKVELSACDGILRKIRKLFEKCGIKKARNNLIAHLHDAELVVKYERDDLIELCVLIKNYQSKQGQVLFDTSQIWGPGSDLLSSFVDMNEKRIKIHNLMTKERLNGKNTIQISDLNAIFRG